MDIDQLSAVLSTIEPDIELKLSGDTNVMVNCLFAKFRHEKGTDSKPSMAINLLNGKVFCHSCHYAAKSLLSCISDLISRYNVPAYEALSILTSWIETEEPTPKVQENKVTVHHNYTEVFRRLLNLPILPNSAEFLKTKGIDVDNAIENFGSLCLPAGLQIPEAEHLKNGVTHEAIGFPCLEQKAEGLTCVGLTARPITVTKTKYYGILKFKSNCHFFGRHLIVPNMPVLAIVEGMLDVMYLHQLGFPSLGLFGSYISDEKISILSDLAPQKVIIIMDNDEPGREAADRILRTFIKKQLNFAYSKIDLTQSIRTLTKNQLQTYYGT